MTLTNKIIKGIGWSSLSMLIITLAQMIQIIILGRILSPEIFGTVALLMIIISFGEFFSQMGLSESVIQEKNPTRTELSSLYCINILLGVSIFTIIFLLNTIFEIYEVFKNITPYLPYIALTFFILPWGQLHKALLQKQLKLKPIAVGESFAAVLATITAIICAYNDLEVWSLIIGYLVRCTVLTSFLIIAGWNLIHFTIKIEFLSTKKYVDFGLKLMSSNILNFINSRVDQLLVGSLLGTQALGYYSMAFNLVIQPISKINPILTRVAFPVLTRFKDEPNRLKEGYLTMLNLVATINAPLLFGVSAVAPVFIPLVIGEQWVPAVPIIQILAIYAFVRSFGNAGGCLVLACGRADLALKWNFLLILFIPITIYLSALFNGLIGVAIGLLLLQIFLFFIWYFKIVKLLIGPCIKDYFNSVFLATVTALIMYLAIVLIPSNTFVSEALNLALLISFGAICYLITNFILRRNEISNTLNLIKSRSK